MSLGSFSLSLFALILVAFADDQDDGGGGGNSRAKTSFDSPVYRTDRRRARQVRSLTRRFATPDSYR